MSEKYKKTFKCLNYVENLLVLVSAFAPLVCVSVGIASFTVGIKIHEITAGIKKYKSIM